MLHLFVLIENGGAEASVARNIFFFLHIYFASLLIQSCLPWLLKEINIKDGIAVC